MRSGLAILLSLVILGLRTAQAPLIAAPEIDVIEIADSGSYYLYSYAAANPSQSSAGIAEIRIALTYQGLHGLEDPPGSANVKFISLNPLRA
jgi:hypothetical protein